MICMTKADFLCAGGIEYRPHSSSSEHIMVKTSRNGMKLLHLGYAYIACRKRGEKTYWRCTRRKICSGRLLMEGEKLVITTPHSHPGDFAYTDCIRLKASLKEHALSSSEGAKQIIDSLIADVPEEVKKQRHLLLAEVFRKHALELNSSQVNN